MLALQKMSQAHFVIIGSGYAGISCAQEIRKNDSDVRITILSREEFCSRPNLFFRFKFLTWHERYLDYYGGVQLSGENSFPEKHNLEIIQNVTVEQIDTQAQLLRYKLDNEEKLNELKYDKLCIATGGTPSVLSFPVIEEEGISDPSFLLSTPYEDNVRYIDDVTNMFVVRNVDEIRLLYEKMRAIYNNRVTGHQYNEGSADGYEPDQYHVTDILVIGSGALALDVVGNIMDGYQTLMQQKKDDKEIVWDVQNLEALPRVTILSRKNVIALPLLQDIQACIMVTERISSPESFYRKYLSLLRNDSVESVLTRRIGCNRVCCGIKTKHGRTVRCSVIIQAVGVESNVSLAKKSDIMIGKRGGILVDEFFLCKAREGALNIPEGTVFAAGDCAELQINRHCPSFVGGLSYLREEQEDNSVVWKNWTSAREQAIECAKCMISKIEPSGTVWFNQTTRLFGLYVACLGVYHFGESIGRIVVKKKLEADARYIKLAFLEEAEGYRLIGSLVVGPDISDYRLGGAVLGAMRLDGHLPKEVVDRIVEIKAAQWTSLLKAVKDVKSGQAKWDDTLISKIIASNETSTAPKKKFVNPLLKKKANVESTSGSTPK